LASFGQVQPGLLIVSSWQFAENRADNPLPACEECSLGDSGCADSIKWCMAEAWSRLADSRQL